MSTNAELVFWGVRGSTPTVDRKTWRYGGNTPCLEFSTPEGSRIILDGGSGLRLLGNKWQENFSGPLRASVLVTHYHWDHIQGLPLFVPLYSQENKFHFYSFRSKYLGAGSLQQAIEVQMALPYYPVDQSVLAAQQEFTEVMGGDCWEIHGTSIRTCWLNHPQGCLAFRLDTSAGSIVYATDNEPGAPELEANLVGLAEGADVFIHDAQYTPEQVAGVRKGWGHSSWLDGVRIARAAGACNLVLFHHDPDSSDDTVDDLLQQARQQFPHVWAAAEGMVMRLSSRSLEVFLTEPGAAGRHPVRFPASQNQEE